MYNNTNLTKIEKMNQLAPELVKAFRAFAEAAMIAASLRTGAAITHATHMLGN